jgi:SagB-type dehydrogenase family enzyme
MFTLSGLIATALGCTSSITQLEPTETSGGETPIPLPSPGNLISLEEALAQRRSIRAFADTPLTMDELGQLAWAAQGITDERGFRTAPSAGALYPLELYVATAEGLYRYLPEGHQLERLAGTDLRQSLYQAALHQDAVSQAPAVFIVTAVYERTAQKYGSERTPRYVHMEVGHAAQNLLLEAVALGLGAVPIGAFHDDEIQSVLGIPADHAPLYLIPVGHPRSQGQ